VFFISSSNTVETQYKRAQTISFEHALIPDPLLQALQALQSLQAVIASFLVVPSQDDCTFL
jgi:hypothetical protein